MAVVRAELDEFAGCQLSLLHEFLVLRRADAGAVFDPIFGVWCVGDNTDVHLQAPQEVPTT